MGMDVTAGRQMHTTGMEFMTVNSLMEAQTAKHIIKTDEPGLIITIALLWKSLPG